MKRFYSLSRNLLALRQDPLYMNSMYMMASTAMVSGSGFFMWMIAARLYPDSHVGLATALISVISLIMNLSNLGFNYSIIRFLPKAKNKNHLLSTSLLIIGIAALLCASIFLSLLSFFSPKHLFINEQPLMQLAFLVFAVTVALDLATEAIFLALRQGKYIFLKNVGIVFLKLLLPMLFVSLGAFGLFMAWATAISSALIVSSYVLIKKFKFTFKPSFKKINLKQLIKFSFTNYIVSLITIAPALVLPLVIANTINAESAAYFYVAFMIANLLYTIPYAVTQSLFAEGAHDEKQLFIHMQKAVKLLGVILIPAILFLLVFGHFILSVFGASYAAEGVKFLQLLAIAGIPLACNFIGLTYLNIHKKMKPILAINIIGALTILLLSFFLREYGLTGIGIAWLAGHIVKTFLYTGYTAANLSSTSIIPWVSKVQVRETS